MSRWSEVGVVQAHTVASTRTVLPAAKSAPSVVDTLMRSLLSSEWNVPEAPSAQLPASVLGWLGSGPLPSRPSRSAVPESHELPTVAHLGARSVASNTAVCAPPPPPAGVTVSESEAACDVLPAVPVTVTVTVPVAAVAEAVSVSVDVALPPAAGVTGLAENDAVTPAGREEALSV